MHSNTYTLFAVLVEYSYIGKALTQKMSEL